MELLNKKGYLILRNIIPQERINFARQNITDKVNYKRIKPFMDNDMLGLVNKELNMNLVCTKYRISNNNNSSDAGNFHRDLQSYAPNELPKVFTCLTYLDTSIMEVLEKSHINIEIPYSNIYNFTKKNKRENILNPGDILIFYATTIHRGIFYKNKTNNRRLIQLFDCVEKNDFKKYQQSILHIPCRPNCSSAYAKFLIDINKKKLGSDILNSIFIVNVFRGYGLPYNALKEITNDKDVRYISTEGNIDRLEIGLKEQDSFFKTNIYVPNFFVKDISPEKRSAYLFYSFMLEFIIDIVFIIFIIVLMVLAFKFLRKNKRKKRF